MWETDLNHIITSAMMRARKEKYRLREGKMEFLPSLG